MDVRNGFKRHLAKCAKVAPINPDMHAVEAWCFLAQPWDYIVFEAALSNCEACLHERTMALAAVRPG